MKVKQLLPLFLTVIISFSSCVTNQVYISVLEPSPVNLAPDTKRIGIINRSKLNEQNKNLNTLHKILRGSADAILSEGSEECIKGLSNGLLGSKRFDEVLVLTSPELRSNVAGAMPVQLDWKTVEDICTKNKLEALFVLELYDTDAKISSPALNPTNVLNPGAVLQSLPQVTLSTIIKAGWRIYIPHNRIILDEWNMQSPLSYTFSGINPSLAEAIMGRKEAIKQESNKMGQNYSGRVLPYWIKVVRDYYIKPKSNFQVATRKSRTGNWDGAAEIWMKETTNAKRKIAGRACYNMAIISEINGNLDEGIKWAQKAYEDYNIKRGRDYVNMLKVRVRDNRILQQQNGN